MNVEVHSEGADHQRIPAPVGLEGDTPIGRHTAELSGRVKRVGTK